MADVDGSDMALSRRAFCGLAGGAIAAMSHAAPATATAKSATNELVMMDATTLAATIRARRASCVEVMAAFLDHIDRHNPVVNAIVARQDRTMLMAEAGRQDDLARRGEWLGALHGFPHAVKDLQPVKGIVSTRGSQIFRDHVPIADGLMVERLRRAGAIFIGKTNVPEFGLGSHSYNAVYGTTRNPYDTTRSAGGSSGGAGAALAMRMLPVADGSDFGGSLRNPAAWNNVIGFRTGFGRIAMSGDDVWFPGMGVLGPMARNIPDLALLLKVQGGHDDRAPLSMESDSLDFTASLSASPKGRRIGWLGDFGGMVPTEPAVMAQCGEALKALEALGCVVEDAVPDMAIEPVWQALLKMRAWQSGGGIAELYAVPERRKLMKPEAIYEVENGLKLSAFDLRTASVVRSQWYNAVRKLFARYDYLIAPATQILPFDGKLDWPHQINGQAMGSYHEWQKGNFLITMSGCPSLAVPAGFTANGLPVGIQIVAPVTRELACLQLGHAYMQANDWTAKRLPPQLA